ncbi:uncharacterized protein LOC124264401 [Haliotis rubra]|uniref:uncharacterized protein LOC124264401 n=1 Tax=Haliotis rubra TaxID=36100 RepID=UPI001EE55AC9|nr:uncharacterized protein LOC124264401 [Haliotis rubra]XP_046555101.1 uncharacterized protein LOC124264401 [Haliotis rubra]
MSGSDSDSSSPNMALDMECEFFSEDGHSTEEEVDSNTQVDPYMFEPVTDESDSEGTPENPGLGYMDNRRTENTEWCKCGQCIAHPTAEECSCCQENPTIVAKIEEVEREGLPPVNCITQHPGFTGVCCNRWVLQTAYFQYRQQY